MHSREIMARAHELLRQAKETRLQAEEARTREIAEVVESIRATMRDHGITVYDIVYDIQVVDALKSGHNLDASRVS